MIDAVLVSVVILWNIVGILFWFGLSVWLIRWAVGSFFHWLLSRD